MLLFYPPNSDGSVQCRIVKDMPSSSRSTHSPYDLEARYSNKRSMVWVGYKAHLTEICDEDSPRIITNVLTTHAAVPDDQVVEERRGVEGANQKTSFDSRLDGRGKS